MALCLLLRLFVFRLLRLKRFSTLTLQVLCFFFSSRRRHTSCLSDWSSDVCSSDLRTVTTNIVNPSGSANLTVGGAIGGGAFALTKAGIGTLTLNGINTYTGATNVNAGKIGRASCRERV